MSSLIPQYRRPSGSTTLGNHESRIRALERTRPITGWRFDYDNEGGSGYLQFNSSVDIDTMPDPLGVGGSWGAAFEDASGDGFLIGSTTVLFLKGDTVEIAAVTSPLTITVAGVKLFEFRDDGTIHIPVGGSVIADL